MASKADRPIPDVSESTLVHLIGQLFVDAATGMVLSRVGYVNSNGYELVQYDGRSFAAHRLVYEAVIGPIPPGLTINHEDGDKLNNRPDNLSPATMSEQVSHAYRTGLRVGNGLTGKSRGSRLTREQIETIRAAPRGSVTRLAAALGISPRYAYDIRNGRRDPRTCS